MLNYIFALGLSFLSWKLIKLLFRWWSAKRCVDKLPLVDGHHWLFGLAYKVKNQSDFLKLFQEYVERKSPRWIVHWTLCLYSNLVPANPDAMQAILTANGIPKNHGFGGAYRMIKPWIGDGLLISGGSKWARNRRLLTPAFHFDILKPYVDIFNETADTFLDKLLTLSQDNKRSFDIMPLVSRATLHALLRCTLSYGDESIQALGKQHPYVSAIHRLRFHVIHRSVNPHLYFDTIYHLTSKYKEFKELCDYVHKLSADIVAERRKTIEQNPSELEKRRLDFVDILLTAKDTDGSGLTNEEIGAEVDTFMFEGHDTTASAVSWAIYSMAKYPDMQNKIHKEFKEVLNGRTRISADDLAKLTYTTCFIKEVLRMYTPVPMTSRKLDRPCTIDGISLPEGQVFDIAPHLIHHNPAVWENHMEFRPERFLFENMANKHPFAFIPFSAGQRNCIGQHFAMNEIKVFICRIAERFHIQADPEREAVPFAELVMGAKDGIYINLREEIQS